MQTIDYEKARKHNRESWQKKHPELMQNLRDNEIFFPIYNQRNQIISYAFHQIIENPPDDLSYSGTGEKHGEAFNYYYSKSTKETYIIHRLFPCCLSAKFRTVEAN